MIAMVRKGGLEPPRLSAPPPQDGVSANSTTSAKFRTWRLFGIGTESNHAPRQAYTARREEFKPSSALKNSAGITAALPSLVHLRPDSFIVNTLDLLHCFCRNRCGVRRPAIVLNLFRTLATGNGTRYGIEHQNPAQRELAHRNTVRQYFSDLVHSLQTKLIIHA